MSPVYVADDFAYINRRWRELSQATTAENWRSASGLELDKWAAGYSISRQSGEADEALRSRIEAVVDKLRTT
jgi:hypothetical protein